MRYVNIKTRKVIKSFDVTADEWELYEDETGNPVPIRNMVADDINRTIVASFNAGNDRETVRGVAHSIMETYRKFGAFDTESRAVLENILDDLYE
jgi:hypothetical protein